MWSWLRWGSDCLFSLLDSAICISIVLIGSETISSNMFLHIPSSSHKIVPHSSCVHKDCKCKTDSLGLQTLAFNLGCKAFQHRQIEGAMRKNKSSQRVSGA